MEKVNVYDWDKTIFPKDSTATFYLWCILRYPKILKALPAVLKLLPAYFRGQISKTRIKEVFYGFLRYVPNIDHAVNRFWTKKFPKINRWYLDHQDWVDNVTSGEYQKYYDSMYRNR